MKIAMISTYPDEKCAIARYSYYLNKELRKYIDIVTIGNLGSNCDYSVNLKSNKIIYKLKEIIKKEKIDLLHFQYMPNIFGRYVYTINYGLLKSLKLKIPKVVTLHEVQIQKDGNLFNKFNQSFLSLGQKKIISLADKIIVHAPSQKSFLENRYKKNNIECIYIFTLPQLLGMKFNEVHKRKGKNLLFFGIISPNKGIEYAIRAMKFLPDSKLTIVGNVFEQDKQYGDFLLNEIKKNNLNNVKTHFGWIPEKDKDNYYKDADLIVLPFIHAPWMSGVLPEAAAYGIPIVITNSGPSCDMIKIFKTGEIAEPKNPESLANAIKKVFENYPKYKKGIIDFKKKTNVETIAKQHFELYKKLLNENDQKIS